jgi:hypothetical protein
MRVAVDAQLSGRPVLALMDDDGFLRVFDVFVFGIGDDRVFGLFHFGESSTALVPLE